MIDTTYVAILLDKTKEKKVSFGSLLNATIKKERVIVVKLTNYFGTEEVIDSRQVNHKNVMVYCFNVQVD